MSREAEALVWKRARAGKSDLLMLVKIADLADDDGRNAFPEVARLMRYCRMSERAVQYTLSRLVAQGEIVIEHNDEGREVVLRGGRRFRPKWFMHVRCVFDWDAYQLDDCEELDTEDAAPALRRGRPSRKSATPADSQNRGEKTARVAGSQGAKQSATPADSASNNPQELHRKSAISGLYIEEDPLVEQKNVQAAAAVGANARTEPAENDGPNDVDCEAMRLAWNDLTSWPLKPIDELTPARLALMKAALTDHPLPAWRVVFARVAASTFLRGGGKQSFIARFEWVLQPAHCIAILEGQYDDHFSAAELRVASQALANLGGICPHSPTCSGRDECVRKYALTLRGSR